MVKSVNGYFRVQHSSLMHAWLAAEHGVSPKLPVQQYTLIRCSCLNIMHARLLTLTGRDAVGDAEIT